MGLLTDSKVLLEEGERRKIRSFVLRGGRLTTLQRRAIEQYSGLYCLPFEKTTLDFPAVFHNDNPVVIEIGFGMGISTARIAAKFPETNYLGIEVFLSGVGKLLDEIHTGALENVRIIRFNAIDVLNEMIKDGSVSGFHIFFPDPWPKKKHHKRRLIQEEVIALMLKKLKAGGYIYTVTDWEPYAEWMLKEFSGFPELNMKNGEELGYCRSISWRPLTKFEQKGIDKEHAIFEIWLEKKSKES